MTPPHLRVALLTTHLPLQQVPSAITAAHLQQTVTLLLNSLQQHYGSTEPHIAVCGLNPHAGEQGYMGHEEIHIIAPTLIKRSLAIQCEPTDDHTQTHI